MMVVQNSIALVKFVVFRNMIDQILFVDRYGHLLVSDFSDSVPSIPPENLQNFIGDPRMRGLAQDEDQVANQLGNGHAPRDVANRNALAVLFESMLPWVHYGDGDDEGAD